MAYQIHLFLVLPLKVWTGNKAEVYNVRQIPALHICITRTRHRLDTAHAGSHAALADNLEKADAAG